MNAFRCMHAIFKTPEFGSRSENDLGLKPITYDNITKDLIEMFYTSLKAEDWNVFVNACACSVALLDAFPTRGNDLKGLVPDIIAVVKDKTETVRKNAAVLLAKMARDEQLKDLIRQHHGMDVLLSLRTAF